MNSREARTNSAYHDLVKFIQWLAARRAVKNHWLLSEEDLIAEGFFVLAKLADKYIDKPYNEFLTLARVAIKNHFGTLRYKALLTYRKEDLRTESFQAMMAQDSDNTTGVGSVESGFSTVTTAGESSVFEYFSDSSPIGCMNPAKFYESMEYLEEEISKLSDFDKDVLNALLGGNDRVLIYINLQRSRKEFLYDNPTILVDPLVISRALCEPVGKVKDSFSRLKLLF